MCTHELLTTASYLVSKYFIRQNRSAYTPLLPVFGAISAQAYSGCTDPVSPELSLDYNEQILISVKLR